MGAKRLFPALACALALVFSPVATAATGDLAVSVSRLTVPPRITLGTSVSFAVRYIVRGPATRRASAKVELVLDDTGDRYRILSNPTRVRPAIWSWKVTDQLPTALGQGTYHVTATVTLTRGKKVVARAQRRATVKVV